MELKEIDTRSPFTEWASKQDLKENEQQQARENLGSTRVRLPNTYRDELIAEGQGNALRVGNLSYSMAGQKATFEARRTGGDYGINFIPIGISSEHYTITDEVRDLAPMYRYINFDDTVDLTTVSYAFATPYINVKLKNEPGNLARLYKVVKELHAIDTLTVNGQHVEELDLSLVPLPPSQDGAVLTSKEDGQTEWRNLPEPTEPGTKLKGRVVDYPNPGILIGNQGGSFEVLDYEGNQIGELRLEEYDTVYTISIDSYTPNDWTLTGANANLISQDDNEKVWEVLDKENLREVVIESKTHKVKLSNWALKDYGWTVLNFSGRDYKSEVIDELKLKPGFLYSDGGNITFKESYNDFLIEWCENSIGHRFFDIDLAYNNGYLNIRKEFKYNVQSAYIYYKAGEEEGEYDFSNGDFDLSITDYVSNNGLPLTLFIREVIEGAPSNKFSRYQINLQVINHRNFYGAVIGVYRL